MKIEIDFRDLEKVIRAYYEIRFPDSAVDVQLNFLGEDAYFDYKKTASTVRILPKE